MMYKCKNKMGLKLITGIIASTICLSVVPGDLVTALASEGVCINVNNFPDKTIRQYVKKFDKNSNGYLSTREIKEVKKIVLKDLSKEVTSFKGLEYFTSLKELYYSAKNYSKLSGIKTLDLTKNTELQTVNIGSVGFDHSKISTIKLDNLKKLEYISIVSKKVKNISLKGCSKVKDFYLEAANSRLSTLDFSCCRNLTSVLIDGVDGLRSLKFGDIRKVRSLRLLDCSGLESLNLKKMSDLEELKISDNGRMANLNLSRNKNLKLLELNTMKKLSGLNLSNNIRLDQLYLTQLPVLKKLDLSKDTFLTDVALHAVPKISTIDVTEARDLTRLEIINCNVSSLNLQKQSELNYVMVKFNNHKMKTLDLSHTLITEAYCRQQEALDEPWFDDDIEVTFKA